MTTPVDHPDRRPPEAELLEQARARRLRFVRFCMLAVAGFAMLQQGFDFLAFDLKPKVFYIFGVRTVFVALTLYLTWLLGTEESERKWDHGILAFWLGVTAIGSLYPFLHPLDDTLHFYFEMGLVFLMYTLLPAQRFARRIPALVLTVGCLWLLWESSPFLADWYVGFLAAGFLLANLLGVWVAKRLRGIAADITVREPTGAYVDDRPAAWAPAEGEGWSQLGAQLQAYRFQEQEAPE